MRPNRIGSGCLGTGAKLAHARWFWRLVSVLSINILIAACGGEAEPRFTAAALELAHAGGNHPQEAERDLGMVTRRIALAAASSPPVRKVVTELFDLAEERYPLYFPGHPASLSVGDFAYRHYPSTGAYLVVDQAALQIYVLGGPFGDAVTLVGEVIDYLKCVPVSAGFPEADLSSGGGDGNGPGTDGGVGATSADGAIRGAEVRLWDGKGALLGQAISDDKGTVRLKSCGSTIGPYKIEFRGNSRATYFDESITVSESASGDWRPFTAADVLVAYAPDLSRHIAVSTYTHAASLLIDTSTGASVEPAPGQRLRALVLRDRMRPLATVDRVRSANQTVRDIMNQQFFGTGLAISDILTPPDLAYSPESLQSFGSSERGKYAQMLAALAKTARSFNPNLPKPAREMTRQLGKDLSDGVLDGKDRQGTAVAPASTQAYNAQTLANQVVGQSMGRLISQVGGFGSVSMNPVGVPCPDGGIGSCFPWGATVTVTAQPGSGARFLSWSGSCATVAGPACVLVMSGDKRVGASFDGVNQQTFALSVGKAGSGSGTVSSVPGGIACGSTCVASFRSGEVVTLAATAAAGSSFTGWAGSGCSGSSPSCTISMTSARSAVATFSTASYTISGSISGLKGAGLVLSDGLGTVSPGPGATSFQFPDARLTGSSYVVNVVAQPAGQLCTVINGSGVIQGASVINVGVDCRSLGLYSVSGTIIGLTGSGLRLALGSTTAFIPQGASSFLFPDALANGSAYSVVVTAQPTGQTCTVLNGSGVVGSAPVTNVEVRCVSSGSGNYTVGGSVSGLVGTGLQLALGFPPEEEICCLAVAPGAGSFAFTNVLLANGTSYQVIVRSQPSGQTCTVFNGSGVISGASVTSVQVICSSSPTLFNVGARVVGLNAWGLGVRLVGNNGPLTYDFTPWAPNTTSWELVEAFLSSDTYTVSVTSQPTGQTCSVPSPSGVVFSENVLVDVICTGTPTVFQVGGRITGLSSTEVSGLHLALNGSITQWTSNSFYDFYFPSYSCDGCFYNVEVIPPYPPGTSCTVINPSGFISGAPVNNIEVNCVSDLDLPPSLALGRMTTPRSMDSSVHPGRATAVHKRPPGPTRISTPVGSRATLHVPAAIGP